MPGQFGNDPHADAEFRLSPAEQVLHIHIVECRQVLVEVFAQLLEGPSLHRLVGRSPPDVVLGFDIADDELVLRRAPGVRSEEHTSELQSLMRIPYAALCLKKT